MLLMFGTYMPPRYVCVLFVSYFDVFVLFRFGCCLVCLVVYVAFFGSVVPAGDCHGTNASHWGNSCARVQWRRYHARRFSRGEVSSLWTLVAKATPPCFSSTVIISSRWAREFRCVFVRAFACL